MEPRRTRSSYLSPPLRSGRSTRMVKSTRVPSHELAKLKASKPMLVIPQPVLRIHECLDENVRMAQVESNAYIALGIKEEPIDEEYDDEGRHYEDADFTPSFDAQALDNEDGRCDETEETEGKRTTRSSKRRRLAGLTEPPFNDEDDNNNSKKPAKKRTSKGKKTRNPQKDFHPVVLRVESLAPAEAETVTSKADLPHHLPAQGDSETRSPEIAESLNNNHEKISKSPDEPTTGINGGSSEPKLRIKNQQTMTMVMSPVVETITPADTSSEQDTSNVTSIDEGSPQNLSENVTALLTVEKADQIETETINMQAKTIPVKESEGFVPEHTIPTAIKDSSVEEEEEDPEYQATSSLSSEEVDSEPEATPKLWALKEEERSTLSCSVCCKKFSRASILTAHKKKHFDPNTYNCTHCNKTFSSESSYKHHIAYSGLAPYKCNQCHKSYYTEQKAETHRAQCQGKNTERKYHCEECGRSYVMLCSLRTHIRERHSDFKPVKNLCCELCGKRFRHKKYLELHMYSHSSEKKFECDICHRKYKSSDILRHHVRMVHKNLPRVACEICQKEVSRVSLKAHLNRHREKQEEEEESARHLLSLSLAADSSAPSCRVCTKYFENEKLLEMHACEGREGGSSFPCQHCNESFTSATLLVGHSCDGLDNSKSRNTAKIYKCIFCTREYNCHTPWLYHVRHHTNDKPYPCPDCDKSFRLKQGLKVHMRNHTGEKPFKCDQCPAAFKQKPFLLDHMNTHTGNKPYQCQKCLARFSVRSALSTHKRIHRRELKRNSEAASSS